MIERKVAVNLEIDNVLTGLRTKAGWHTSLCDWHQVVVVLDKIIQQTK